MAWLVEQRGLRAVGSMTVGAGGSKDGRWSDRDKTRWFVRHDDKCRRRSNDNAALLHCVLARIDVVLCTEWSLRPNFALDAAFDAASAATRHLPGS